jgi:DNA-binding transcriptional ArsR family regulator
MESDRGSEAVTQSNKLELRDEKLLFYSLLKNPIRREIISLLKENGSMAATDLKRMLGISVGTLYYHIEFMKPFVVKNPKRRYMLSEKGLRLVESMKVSDYLAEASVGAVKGPRRILLTLSLNPLLERVQLSNATLVPVGILSSLLYVLLSWRISNSQLLLHFRQLPTAEAAFIMSAFNLVLLIALTMFLGFLTSLRLGGEAAIATTLPIALTPSNIILTYFAVLSGLGLNENPLVAAITPYVYFGLHLWQMATIAAVLVSAKGVSWERAVIASIALSYLSLYIAQNI